MTRKKTKLHIHFIIYWVVLLVWQNFIKNDSLGTVDIILKFCLIAYISVVAMKNIRWPKLNQLWGFFVFSSYIIFLMLFVDTAFSASTMVSYIFIALFSFIFLILNDKNYVTVREYHIFLKLIIVVDIFICLYSFIVYPHYFSRIFSISSAYGNELSSFLISNHECGMYLMFGIVACVILMHERTKRRRRVTAFWYFVLAAIFALNLVLAFSRTALLACVLFVVAIVLLLNKNKTRRFLIFLIGVALLVVWRSSTIQKFIFEIILKENNDAGRMVLANVALSYFKDSPLIYKIMGHGFGATDAVLENLIEHSSVHNAYLQILLVGGIVGLFFLVYVLISSLRFALKTYHYNKFYGTVFIGLIISCVSFMFTNTAVVFMSPIDSYMLTVFTILIPKYVGNYLIYKEKKLV